MLAGCAAAVALSCSVRASEWTEDYAAAQAQAKKEHKLILLDFTGSDWCGWCKKIDRDVFSTPKFKEFADKNLVLVTVDFPHNRPISDAVKAQNKSLSDKYSVDGFPTLIVIDADGKTVFQQVGYEEGGPEAFLAKFPKSGS